MFNEKEHKDYSSRIQLTLKRNQEGILSPWQISNLIVKMSSHYYKNELLNTIALAINNGIRPSNIFIMDDSFQVNNSYTYVDRFDLGKNEDVKNLYHLGVPTSLFPNKKLFKLNICFKLFSDYYTLLNSKGLERPDKNKLKDIVGFCISETDITIALDELKRLATNIVEMPSYDKIDTKDILNKIENLYKRSLKKFIQFETDEEQISILNDEFSIGSLSVKRLQDKNNSLVNIEREYYKRFFKLLGDLKRPIVGIYYPETGSIQIICKNFINKNARDSKFIDLKEVRHNSPYLVTVLIGIGIGAPLLKAYQSVKDDRTLALNELRLIEEDEKTQEELEQIYSTLEDISQQPENNAINNIENQYLKDRLNEIQHSNNLKFNEPITMYGFSNTNMEINLIQQNYNNHTFHTNNK
jgi:hypothetical protein